MHIFKNALLQTVYPNRPLLTQKKKKTKQRDPPNTKQKIDQEKKNIYIYI